MKGFAFDDSTKLCCGQLNLAGLGHCRVYVLIFFSSSSLSSCHVNVGIKISIVADMSSNSWIRHVYRWDTDDEGCQG